MRVALQDTQIGSDARFAHHVRTFIVRATRNGAERLPIRSGDMKLGTERIAGRGTRVGCEAPRVDMGSAGMAPKSLLVCFSGKIGSGKTSTSRAVASALGCRRASFGGYLKDEVARRGGDPDCRESVQDFGQSRIEQDAELFCRDVLASGGFAPGEDLVLDGVRHVGVLSHLGRIAAPTEVRLIFLKVEAGVRSNRVGKRSAGTREDFDRAARHVVEADMEDKLPMAAHAIVDGSLPEQERIRECIGLIAGWRWAGSCIASVPVVRRAAVSRRRK